METSVHHSHDVEAGMEQATAQAHGLRGQATAQAKGLQGQADGLRGQASVQADSLSGQAEGVRGPAKARADSRRGRAEGIRGRAEGLRDQVMETDGLCEQVEGLRGQAMDKAEGYAEAAGLDAAGMPDLAVIEDQFHTLKSVALVVPLFYASYYALAGTLSGAFGTTMTGLEPFEHEEFTPAADSADMRPLVVWLSTVLTFGLFGPWIIYYAVDGPRKAVDVATTLQGMHVFATTTFTQSFPENWIWWATMMSCMFFQGRVAQFMKLRFTQKSTCMTRFLRRKVEFTRVEQAEQAAKRLPARASKTRSAGEARPSQQATAHGRVAPADGCM